MDVFGWNYLKFGICGLYTTKFCMKIFFSKKVNFLTRCHEKLKKVAIFSKKREKAIFFFKNGQIDPKIGQIEVPQYTKLFTLGIFEILSFSDFMTQNGGNFSEK